MTPNTINWTMELVLYAISLQKLILQLHFDHSTSIIDHNSSVDTLPRIRVLKLSCADVPVEIVSRAFLRLWDSLRVLFSGTSASYSIVPGYQSPGD